MEGWKDQAMRLRFHHIKSTNTGCQVSTRTFSSFPACESSDGIGSHSKVDHFGPSLAELQALPNWHTNSAYQASDQCIINIHKCFHSGETYHHQYVIVHLIIPSSYQIHPRNPGLVLSLSIHLELDGGKMRQWDMITGSANSDDQIHAPCGCYR